MPFGNKKTLTDRFKDDQYLIDVDPAKLEGNNSIGADVSDLIYQKTNYPPPNNPDDAPGMLRGIWCDIVLFKIIKFQKELPEEEIKRRIELKNDAYKLLNEIQEGRTPIRNGNGTPINVEKVIEVQGVRRLWGFQ
jgi:hypothetical protein